MHFPHTTPSVFHPDGKIRVSQEYSSAEAFDCEYMEYHTGKKEFSGYAGRNYDALGGLEVLVGKDKDGARMLIKGREQELADMIGVSETLLFNSGMAALHCAMENENLRQDDVILVGEEAYSRTKELYTFLEDRGIRVIRIGKGNTETFLMAMDQEKPRVVFFESVANSPEMPIIDLAFLLKKAQEINRERRETEEKEISFIIDNSLPSPVLYNPIRQTANEEVSVMVVESATKHYQAGCDVITMGIAYSNDTHKMKSLRNIRSLFGAILQPVAEATIPPNITKIMPDIMKIQSHNSLELAHLLSQSPHLVHHPGLVSHPQHTLATKMTPDGAITTLFYIHVKNARMFVNKIKELLGDNVGIGVSFGHSKTWMMPLPGDHHLVRIAVGSETGEEWQKVLSAFQQGTCEMNNKN